MISDKRVKEVVWSSGGAPVQHCYEGVRFGSI
jgi:hypothetical protein